MNFKDDLEFLLQGVSEFDIQCKAVPSDIFVHGSSAFPIGLTPAGQTFLAGAYFGQGRVIVASHDTYLGLESLSTFMTNAVHWLDKKRNGVQEMIEGLTHIKLEAERLSTLVNGILNTEFNTKAELAIQPI